jgi:outer membrane protein OmpA-like peptidoglycan-associated protein
MSDPRLGYPFRTMVVFAAALAIAVVFIALPVSLGLAWTVAAIVTLLALLLLALRSRQITRAHDQSAHVLAALGATTADLPVSLRTRMPLVLVTGDALAQLFNRGGDERLAHVGDGAIWLRVSRPQDLPQLAVAVKQWRDGRAPDGIVLSLAPALHASEDALTQMLRVARQAVSDASRMLGARFPAYIAVYQRLTTEGSLRAPQDVALGYGTNAPMSGNAPQWYGVSSATPLVDAQRFEDVMRAAEGEVQRAHGDPVAAARAAALASIIGWTHRVVVDVLTDRMQPATPWRLFGAGWIDCGPASDASTPWARDVAAQTRIVPPSMAASPAPWPLPQPLIQALPSRVWVSPRMAALAQAMALVACAGALAIWGAGSNNQTLLTHIGADLGRVAMRALVTDRDQLDRYGRIGVPLRLSFGMYRGAMLMPALNDAIASYQPPPPPPAVVTLDSMSLFDSGSAQLKPGSTRAMVGALEMIKAHPDKRVLVAGYTDNVGNPDSNLKLSIARAGAVRDWLIDASGIAATQFAIQGYGDTRPIASNETDAGRAKNRRVEITLVPDVHENQRQPGNT